MTTVRVNRKAADRAASGHPWIFASDVVDRGDAAPGDAVRVLDPESKFLGVAHYSSTSQITLRLLSDKAGIDRPDFFSRALTAALAHRERVVQNSDAYRLVFSEGDLLPGLIVDRYGPYLALQTLNQGMDRARDVIVDCLQELLAPAGILARNDASVRKLEGLPLEVVTLAGEIPERVHIQMNGLKLEADLLHGQKTGVYLDQRENYLAAATLGARAGAGLLHLQRRIRAARGGAGRIGGSAWILRRARWRRRRRTRRPMASPIFIFAKPMCSNFLSGIERRYSMVVLDPPAFAKSRRAVDDAARGYKEINLRALRLLDPGGVLVTCSCSHHMSEGAFYEVIAQAALDAGKTLRVLERRTQASDHPILLTVPETMYLKCLVLEVL